MLPLKFKDVSDEFDLSASNNLAAPSLPISLSVLSQNELKQQACTADVDICEKCV
jgi:hypothetical protein